MAAYYNEHDPKAAAWLRELIQVGAIAPGVVDERDIRLVRAGDLDGFAQCHFFAGIGGWSYALRLAGWADDAPIWTGSCPCQPFSQAGKRAGKADPRHLWPQFRRLIRQCRPATVFGEQVESRDGRAWLSGVFADLEALGYRAAGADLCAAGQGAPHIRQRLYWVADDHRARLQVSQAPGQRPVAQPESVACGDACRLEHKPREQVGLPGQSREQGDAIGGLSNTARAELRSIAPAWNEFGDGGNDFVFCQDGRVRRIESGSFPLAYGLLARVGRLRGYGNAIVPQVAAEFIKAYATV